MPFTTLSARARIYIFPSMLRTETVHTAFLVFNEFKMLNWSAAEELLEERKTVIQ